MRIDLSSQRPFRTLSLVLASVVITLITSPVFAQNARPQGFLDVLKARLVKANNLKASRHESLDAQVQKLCPYETNAAVRRILFQYGAVFTGTSDVHAPDRCVFKDEVDVGRFQSTLKASSVTIADTKVELQEPAMNALTAARAEASKLGLNITPLDGSIAARRTYADTVRIWNSRFDPAIKFWIAHRRISSEEERVVRAMDIFSLIEQVANWEDEGMFFGTGMGSSIFSSVAPPGTSQHLSMLALDVVEHNDPRIRSILTKNGWFQTIKADMTHFTYLGVPKKELPSRGLNAVVWGGRQFWVPAPEPLTVQIPRHR